MPCRPALLRLLPLIRFRVICFRIVCSGVVCVDMLCRVPAAGGQPVNLEQRRLAYDRPCAEVSRLLHTDEASTPDVADANRRWWNGAMAAGGLPSYNVEFDHYRIIDEFFEVCDRNPTLPIGAAMHGLGLQHRWITDASPPPPPP